MESSILRALLIPIVIVATVGLGTRIGIAATFTVTTTADSGAGSLRQAILEAENSAGADTIVFDIPAGQCAANGVCTVGLNTPLPLVTESLTIDATTQPRHGSAPANVCATAGSPSYLRVQLDFVGTPDADAEFRRILDFRTVSASQQFTVRGIAFTGDSSMRAIDYHTYSPGLIQCNHFCTGGTGLEMPDLGTGLCVYCYEAGGNLLVGTDGDGVDDHGERNVFGCTGIGVNVNSGDPSYPNTIAGNYFCVGADGITPMDDSTGVFMRQSVGGNLIGSTAHLPFIGAEANLFANCFYGVWLSTREGSLYTNAVSGNIFGRDAAGKPAPNGAGIRLDGASTDIEIRYNQFLDNFTGIEVRDTATVAGSSSSNCLVGNSTGANHQGDTVDLELESNYWGAPDGPSGVGPGTGDSIVESGTGTVSFTPFLVSPKGACLFVFVDGFDDGTLNAWSAAVGD